MKRHLLGSLIRLCMVPILIYVGYAALGTGRASHAINTQQVRADYAAFCGDSGKTENLQDCANFYNRTIPLVVDARSRHWPFADGPDKQEYGSSYKSLLAMIAQHNGQSARSQDSISVRAYATD